MKIIFLIISLEIFFPKNIYNYIHGSCINSYIKPLPQSFLACLLKEPNLCNLCNFWPRTFFAESHLRLREKNYFPLLANNLETTIRVCFTSACILISHSISLTKTVHSTFGEAENAHGFRPSKPHIRIFFVSENAYEKDEQYSTADNQRTCYSKRR